MNGIEKQVGGKAEIVRLDLLGSIGRQAARVYGVNLVPVTLLFDGSGKIVYRHTGLPNAKQVVELIANIRSIA